MITFQEQLAEGQAGESVISLWLRKRGWCMIPIYEKIIDTGKGPQVFSANDESIVAPDMLAIKNSEVLWVEAKTKSGFTWHRITRQWTTGIDRRHYDEYRKLQLIVDIPIWVMFLQKGCATKDSPSVSADELNRMSGLFANSLYNLAANVNHTSDKWGSSGMIYWSIESLKKIATLEEVSP